MGSRRYLLKKVGQSIFTLFFVLSMNFFLFRILPSDPVASMTRAQKLTRADQAALIHEWGMDRPLREQFLIYISHPLNFGLSFQSSRPVSEVIGKRVWPTVLLVGISTILSTIIGVLIGISSAWRRGSRLDVNWLVSTMTFYSMPDFWFGMMLLLAFAATLHWFPISGYMGDPTATGWGHIVDVARHLVLPVTTLTIGYLGEYSLIMRSSLIDVMNEDFVGVARAKGLPDRLVRRRHAVPNALLPIVTMVILYFGYVLGGAVGVETVFSYPGLGKLTYEAIDQQDFPVMQAMFLLFSAAVIIANLIADITYGYLDPRVREA